MILDHLQRSDTAADAMPEDMSWVPPMPAQRSLGSIRSRGEGSWAQTELGKVHYKLYNKEALVTQTMCVFVHGFSIPGVKHFAPIAEIVSKRGVPVLTLDLFGRGLSDRLVAPNRYDGELYTECVVGLLRALKLDKARVDILGFSMGGGVIQVLS
jgi:pimeloyl-ACP methyl ester carboxylesterase